jgi:cytochrome c peroxidase
VPAVKDNAVTHEKVDLGKLLFFDPRLSVSEIISCNTCHNLGTGGVDAGPTSVGHGWQKGPRRAPTVYNAVFNVAAAPPTLRRRRRARSRRAWK